MELPSDPERRAEILDQPFEERIKYAQLLFDELFVDTWEGLKKWRDVTNQTAQPDSGYIAQHLASLVSGIEGPAQRGKGDDLSDGSEVKTASSISGIDRPRWNHRITSQQKVDEWFKQPNVFYTLIDRNDDDNMRVRLWRIQPPNDSDYQKLLQRWFDEGYTSNNFQMHPPLGEDSNRVTKDVGDIRLPLHFEMVLKDTEIETTFAEENPERSELVDGSLEE